MTHVELDDVGDLRFIFAECDTDVVVYRLDNGAEVEFCEDECVGFVLPNFERQLNCGKINDVSLTNINIEGTNILFDINVNGQNIQGKVDFSSLKK